MVSAQPDSARRRQSSRQATLDAAWELVAEVPYAKVTVEAIAARAGVSKATIYRWWPSRGAVVIDAFADRSVDGELPDTGDFAADMRAVVRSVVEEFGGDEASAFFRALTVETLQDSGLRAQVAARVYAVQLGGFSRRFASARAAGQLRGDVPDALVLELLVGPVLHRWQGGVWELTREYADQVVDLALRALSS